MALAEGANGRIDVFRRWIVYRPCLILSFAAALGCSGSAPAGDEGSPCFRALDCRGGLICVEGECSADLTPVIPEGDGPAAPDETTPGPDAGR
jgi:hypothetical protein